MAAELILSCIDACVATVLRAPELYETIHENYRRSLVRRFPFAVFYEYETGGVTIYSVFHTSRDPAKWHRRLP